VQQLEEEEIHWLQMAQAGNTEAYTTLQLALEPEVRRFVQRHIQHTETTDDIVQDVFIRFYTNLHKIDPPERFRPYLFRIARNACYDDLRGSKRREESLDDDAVEVRVSFIESRHQQKHDDATHWMLLGLEVKMAIEQLPDAQRQTLLMFSEQGMSYAEIAEATNVTVGTVKSRLFYAKKNLRGYLKPTTVELLDEEFS